MIWTRHAHERLRQRVGVVSPDELRDAVRAARMWPDGRLRTVVAGVRVALVLDGDRVVTVLTGGRA